MYSSEARTHALSLLNLITKEIKVSERKVNINCIRRDKQRQKTYRGNIEMMYSSRAHAHLLSQPNLKTKLRAI